MPGIMALLVALLLASPGSGGLADEPGVARFPLTDRGPLNGLLGIPDGWTSIRGPTAELSWQIANNAMGQQAGSESLLLDGETHSLNLRWQHRFGQRLSLGMEIPWMSHSGGFLDRSIDAWHDLLGLSDGIRPELPTDNLSYVYARDGDTAINMQSPTSGFGDLRTSAAWRLRQGREPSGRAGGISIDLTADINWPTGDPDRLTGSGGTDVAAGLRAGRPAPFHAGGTGRFGWSAQAGILWPGDVDAPLPPASGQIYYYDVSLAWAASQAVDAVLQVEGHSGAWQSQLKMLGKDAAQLGLGLLWRFARDYGMRLAILEDIRTDTTPDFTIELAIVLQPGGTSGPATTGLLDSQ